PISADAGHIEVSGNLTNAASGTFNANSIQLVVDGSLANSGSIISISSLQGSVGGKFSNQSIVRSGGDLTIEAASLVNNGTLASIAAKGDLSLATTGLLQNTLGQILSEKDLTIDVGSTLTNASGRIESKRNMQLVANRLNNTALAGTDGGTIDLYNLGDLTIEYEYDHDNHVFYSVDQTKVTASQDEFSGTIDLEKAGVIRSGVDLTIDVNVLHNENGRILAVDDLSISSRQLINDAQTYYVNHYKNAWFYETDDGYLPFYAPRGAGWSVNSWKANVLTNAGFQYLLSGLDTKTSEDGETLYLVGQKLGKIIVSGSDGPREQTALVDAYYTEEYLRSAEGQMVLFEEVGTLLISQVPSSVSVGGSDSISQSKANELAKLKVLSNADASRYVNLAALGIDPDNIPETLVLSSHIGSLGTKPYVSQGKTYVGQTAVLQGSVIKAGERLSIDSDVITNRGTLSGSTVSIEGGTLANGIGTVSGVSSAGLGRLGAVKTRNTEINASSITAPNPTRAGAAAVSQGSNVSAINPTGIGVSNADAGSSIEQLKISHTAAAESSGSAVAVNGVAHTNASVRASSSVGLSPYAANSVQFVLDDVAVPPLNLGAFSSRNVYSINLNNFGNLVRYTGSMEAARLLSSVGSISGSTLAFYADPVQEAKALSDALRLLSASQMKLDATLSPEDQREQLYANAAAFAARTGAQFGVALTEAQRAALDEPIVWYETRIVDGTSVLVPRLYSPSSDELLRGSRGAGLISADELTINLSNRLTNSGAITASDLASISASSIVNERLLNLDNIDRDYAAGRADSGLISAGTLLLTTDGDLVNRGGTLASSGDIELRIGGSVLNLTQRYTRAVDAVDGCMGSACGGNAVDYAIARITAGGDLTIIADQDIINRGGELGSVTDMLLAAGRNVEFETLKDAFLTADYHQRGFLSGTDIVEYSMVSANAAAQSLLGDVSIFSGYGVCDGGALCSKGSGSGDTVLNGALVSAFGDLAVTASGEIDMGVVSREVNNQYSDWGFAGLGWGTTKQAWNDIGTSVTQLSGSNVTLDASGPITGTGAKIAAINDLIMQSDATIQLAASQDALYFTEKGFYIGLTFPGSAAIDAALGGGDSGEVLSGLASINPLTATLARLGSSENGLAAGLAATYVGVGGLEGIRRLLAGDPSLAGQASGLTPEALEAQIGLSLSGWRTDQRWSESQAAQLTAGGDIVMRAGVDALLTQGTRLIAAGNVTVEAERDIQISALLDYARQQSSALGLTVSQQAVSGSISKAGGNTTLVSNGNVEAGGELTLTAGRDISLIGGTAAGERVVVDVGRDLTITSLQDTSTFKQTGIGLSISYNGAVSGSYSSTKADYANVSEQSGIVAGKGGFDVRAGGTVDMTAGLIVSSADPALNSLEAGRLVVRDLENRSEASTFGLGTSISGGKANVLHF
ncbi:MAG: hemagglutinin repeat-containing protein, partial [Rhizobiaceae bacterium]|nr:hemagglutinin repeat-containing protein [Rhizobiaceae bacterium]